MKKVYAIVVFGLLSFLVFSNLDTIAQSSSATWALTANGDATITGDVTASSIVFGSEIDPPNGSGSAFGTNGVQYHDWNSATINLNDYYEYSIAPATGYDMDVTQVQFTYSNSGNKSMNGSVYYSLDGFATAGTQLGSDFGVSQTATSFNSSGLSVNVTDGQTFTLRIYGWSAHNGQVDFHNKDVIVYATTTTFNWIGTTSTDWNTTSNWSDNLVPNAGSNVLIPTSPSGGNYPETNSGSGAVCNDLEIETGAHLYIPATNTLSVNGTLINSAGTSGLVIESTSGGTGSLLHNTAGVDATVKQYLTDDEWHYTSSPITNAVSNVFYDIYLRTFDEASYSWNNYITATNVPLEIMKGYSAWTFDVATVAFEGPLNNGSQSIAVSNTTPPTGTYSGWNLVGNPFPSALDWDASTGWTRTNVDLSIYFWKGVGAGGGGNYYVYNGGDGTGDATQYIPATQGYFVHASADATLGVDNNARVHNSQAYYKTNGNKEIPLVRLEAINSDGIADETIIRFNSKSTSEYDGDYDGFKLSGYLVPQLYSITDEKVNLAINTLPHYNKNTTIPLGFESPEAGKYSISLTEFVNFKKGVSVYLEDLLMNELFNLSNTSEYTFMSTPEDDANRFRLHFAKEKTTGVDEMDNAAIDVYSFDKNIYIQLLNDENQILVKVYDIMGKEVLQQNISGQELNRLSLNAGSGYYVVTVQSGSDFYTEKVYIR